MELQLYDDELSEELDVAGILFKLSSKTAPLLKVGDVVPVEARGSTKGGVSVRILRHLSFLPQPPTSGKLLVLEIEGVLGITNTVTGYFKPRPHAREFLLWASRRFTLLPWTAQKGAAIACQLFFPFVLPTCWEESMCVPVGS